MVKSTRDFSLNYLQSLYVLLYMYMYVYMYNILNKLLTEEQGLSSSLLGKVKLELAYKVKQQCLSVMVRHVKDLVRSLCTMSSIANGFYE